MSSSFSSVSLKITSAELLVYLRARATSQSAIYSLTTNGSLCDISIPITSAFEKVMFCNCSVSSSMALSLHFYEDVVFLLSSFIDLTESLQSRRHPMIIKTFSLFEVADCPNWPDLSFVVRQLDTKLGFGRLVELVVSLLVSNSYFLPFVALIQVLLTIFFCFIFSLILVEEKVL